MRRSIKSSDAAKKRIQEALLAKNSKSSKQQPVVTRRDPAKKDQKVVKQAIRRPQRIATLALRPPSETLYTVEGRQHRIELPENGCFNPALLDLGDKFLMVYRPNELELIACFIDEGYKPIQGSFLKLPLMNVADPRLVLLSDGRVLLSYSRYFSSVSLEHIAANFIMDLNTSRSKIFCGPSMRVSPKTLAGRQKNWMPFAVGSKVFFVAQVCPHEIYEFNIERPESCAKRHHSRWTCNWFYAPRLRGNTNPVVLEDGRFLGTFHTSTAVNGVLHYDNGFYLFDSAPPFQPVSCSQRSYLPAEAAVEPHYRKAGQIKCTFPCGMVRRGQNLIISYGDNDSSVKILETTVEEALSTFKRA